MRSPNPDDVDRATLHQWNLTFERRLPLDLVASVAYVGTQTNGGYADINLNYAEPGTGNAGRQFFTQAGNANILDWGNWTTSKYHSLQMAVNRPFKNGLLLKGAYTWSKAMNETDDDGWTGLTLEHPEPVRPQLRARRATTGRTSCRWASSTSCRSSVTARASSGYASRTGR